MIPYETKACDLAPLLAEALRSGQSVRFRAEGQSMQPFIRAGDIAVVAPAPPVAALRRGDVLLYERAPGVLRLHRLQRILPAAPPVLLLRGDAPEQSMERVASDRVLGVLTTYERNGRTRSARHPLRRFAGLAWPRLRNHLRAAAGWPEKLHILCRELCRKLCRPMRPCACPDTPPSFNPNLNLNHNLNLNPNPNPNPTLSPTLSRLRLRLRLRPTPDKASERPADPPALILVKAALKTTLRGTAGASPAPAVDPQALVATARRHGVLAICAGELIRRCPAAEAAIRDALRAMALEGETSRTYVAEALDALRGAGLAPLVVKGPALAALAYGDPTVRPYDDVDLLLDGPGRAQALDVLQRVGWHDSRNTPPLAQRHLLRTTEDLALVHPRCEVALELVHPGGILRDAAPAAESPPCPFEIHGAVATAPSKADHFLYCAAHGAKHGYTRLVWLADLDRLAVNFTDADWASVVAQARVRRLTRALGLSAVLAQKLLATPFPPQIEAVCKDADWIAEKATRCLEAQARGTRHVETWRWWMALQDTSWQRLHAFRVWLFQPTGADLRVALLPLWAHSAYAVLRPLRLLIRLILRRPAPRLTW